MLDINIVWRHTQFGSDNLRKGRFMPLPLRLHPNTCQRFARRVNSNLTAIEHLNTCDIEVLPRTSSDNLGEARDTDSHQFSSRPLLSLLAT